MNSYPKPNHLLKTLWTCWLNKILDMFLVKILLKLLPSLKTSPAKEWSRKIGELLMGSKGMMAAFRMLMRRQYLISVLLWPLSSHSSRNSLTSSKWPTTFTCKIVLLLIQGKRLSFNRQCKIWEISRQVSKIWRPILGQKSKSKWTSHSASRLRIWKHIWWWSNVKWTSRHRPRWPATSKTACCRDPTIRWSFRPIRSPSSSSRLFSTSSSTSNNLPR